MISLMGNCISCIKQRRQPKRPIKLAILGLDSAGKTTISKALNGDDLDTAPTIGFSKEEITFSNYEITLYDLGGGKKIRGIWKDYTTEIYGVIYVVDSSTRERLPEVKENLKALLSNEEVKGKPLLVLVNKVDLENHMDEVDVMEGLGLEDLVNINKCPSKLEMCSAIKGTGKKMDINIKNGLLWLCGILDQVYDELKVRVDKNVAIMNERLQKEREERRERVRKIREERERQEEEERKRLGIEKEEDEDDDIVISGDPFKKLTSEEIQRKEEKYRKAREKEKENQKRLKDLDEQNNSNNTLVNQQSPSEKTTVITGDDDDFRAPLSNRARYSFGVINGGFTKPVLGDPGKTFSDEEENGGIPNMTRPGRQMLPPLQSPLGTKFMGNSPRPGKEKKKNKKKLKPVDPILEVNSNGYSYSNEAQEAVKEQSSLSYSKIHVAAQGEGYESDDTVQSRTDSVRGGRKAYVTENGVDSDVMDNGNKKKGKKKKSQLFSNEDNEDFDTLRLSQHLEDESERSFREGTKPPLSPVRDDSKPKNANTVRKLKKKKLKPLRRNKLAPSDDEFELSDVQTSPQKKPIDWTRSPSPKKMLDSLDKWGMAEELEVADEVHPFRRSRPNVDSEDDLIL